MDEIPKVLRRMNIYLRIYRVTNCPGRSCDKTESSRTVSERTLVSDMKTEVSVSTFNPTKCPEKCSVLPRQPDSSICWGRSCDLIKSSSTATERGHSSLSVKLFCFLVCNDHYSHAACVTNSLLPDLWPPLKEIFNFHLHCHHIIIKTSIICILCLLYCCYFVQFSKQIAPHWRLTV